MRNNQARGWWGINWLTRVSWSLAHRARLKVEAHVPLTPEETVETAERAVALSVKTFGEDAGPTSRSREALAKALDSAGKPVEARVLREQVVSAYRRNRGPEDEQTLHAELSLVASLAGQGMHKEALPLAVHVRDGLGHIKGIKSSDVATAEEWVRALEAQASPEE